MPNENQPFEASYEAAKQSIISYLGEVSRVFDLPIPILNILIYEIALESRNATFASIVGGCEIKYPNNIPNDTSKDNKENNQTKKVDTKEALKELEALGVQINKTNEPSSKSA